MTAMKGFASLTPARRREISAMGGGSKTRLTMHFAYRKEMSYD